VQLPAPSAGSRTLACLDDVGVGLRFQALTLEAEGPAKRTIVMLDRPARNRLFEIVSATTSARDDRLVGVLVEADFESNTARVRTTGGQRIAIRSETELADSIQEGLRRQAEFLGEVSYDPKTLESRSVSLRRIVRGDWDSMPETSGRRSRSASSQRSGR